jgi:predicted protein tyrosine phosphatase
MPNITIASYEDANMLMGLASDNFAHVVSINDPEKEPPPMLKAHGARRLVLSFYDVLYATRDRPTAPSEEDVARVIEFAAGIAHGESVLVHCAAGISRSSGMALTILATKRARTAKAAKDLYTTLRAQKDDIWPNPTIIGFTDRLLGFRGALGRAHVENFPQDHDRF